MNAREALLDECICRFERMQAQYDQCTLDIRNMTGQLNGHREQLEAYLSKTAAMLSRTQSDSMRDVSFTSSSSDSTSPSASSSSSSSSSASSSPVYRHQDLDKHVEQIKASLHHMLVIEECDVPWRLPKTPPTPLPPPQPLPSRQWQPTHQLTQHPRASRVSHPPFTRGLDCAADE